MEGLIKFLQKYIRLEVTNCSYDIIGGKQITIHITLYFKNVMISSAQTVIHI